MKSNRLFTGIWRNIGFVCVIVVLMYCVVHAFDPPRLNWGDSASDYNAMTAGRNFQKYGFVALKFTPFVLDPAVMTPSDSALMYTHYPQLPDVMNGVLRVAFGMTDIVQFRFVALLFSFASLFFIYQLACAYWSRQTAQCTLALWVVNPLWIQHADYLHHLPYAAFFGFGCLYFLVRYLRGGGAWWFAASGVFLFFTFFASYDYWFFEPLLIAAVVFHHYRRVGLPAIRVLGILAACALAAMLLKWSTNAWALGGVTAFLRDLRFQVVERATNKAVRVAYHDGIWLTLDGRVERFFTLLLFPITAFWLVHPLLRRRFKGSTEPLVQSVANPIVLLLAALPFLAVFTELWVGQYYPTLLVLPFYAVGSALLVTMLMASEVRAVKIMGAAVIAALILNSFDEDVSFPKAFFDRRAIASLKTNLDSLSEPGQQILVDHVFDAAYRYYFGHNTVAMILNPPERFAPMIEYYSDPRLPRIAPAAGALFVQHKKLTEEMYDKGYYYILGRSSLWGPWANPRKYHAELDQFIAKRDSELVAAVAANGDKVVETDFYVIWRLRHTHAPIAPPPSSGAAKH